MSKIGKIMQSQAHTINTFAIERKAKALGIKVTRAKYDPQGVWGCWADRVDWAISVNQDREQCADSEYSALTVRLQQAVEEANRYAV